jgi:hypothetical protein
VTTAREDVASAVRVLGPVEPGCIVAIADPAEGFDHDELAGIVELLVEKTGHKQFAVVLVPEGGKVGVFGPEDLVDAIRSASAAGCCCSEHGFPGVPCPSCPLHHQTRASGAASP